MSESVIENNIDETWCPRWAKISSQIGASFGVVGSFMGLVFLWRGLMQNDYAGVAYFFGAIFLAISVATITTNLLFKKTKMKIWFFTAMVPSIASVIIFLFITSAMVGPFIRSLG